MMRRLLIALGSATALSGCSLAPKYTRPAIPVPSSWPVGDAYLRQSEATLPSVTYTQIFLDRRLQSVIDLALANNRDVRIAAANIAAARARYRIQRADLFPQIDASGRYSYSDNGSGGVVNPGGAIGSGRRIIYSANVGTTAFEIDLFGRIRSLTGAALNRYFGTEAAARATRLTLVGDVAEAWLNYAADRSLLVIAQQTAATALEGVRLTDARLQGGIAPRTDLLQAQQILETARADVAQQTTALAQDVNLLQLLVGAPIGGDMLPPSIEAIQETVASLPPGLDSAILLRRPDVVQAEYELRATNAEIGVARAEMFPRLSLTGALGFASTALSSLFSSGAFNFSVAPTASYSIFRAGAAKAGVAFSQAQRDAALASYERAVQTAFRETADALAREGTIVEQLRANRTFAQAAVQTDELVTAQYRGGVQPYLASLDAQRQLYSAQRTLVQTQLTSAVNRVSLYRVLGGDTLVEATPNGLVPVRQQP